MAQICMFVLSGQRQTDWLVTIIKSESAKLSSLSIQRHHMERYQLDFPLQPAVHPQVNLWVLKSLPFSSAWYHSMEIVFHCFFFIGWILHWFPFCSTSLHSSIQDWCFHLIFSLMSFWTFPREKEAGTDRPGLPVQAVLVWHFFTPIVFIILWTTWHLGLC